jgi:hypothetical protein
MNMVHKERKLKVGDWVEVRSKEEILRTLDLNGRLHGMPFMPEMFAFCGQRFKVYKRAHKTCDTVFPVRGRRVDRAVHLETRCDGSAHGGCHAGCLIFWKDAWLKPVSGEGKRSALIDARSLIANNAGTSIQTGCRESDVTAGAQAPVPAGAPARYVCQATQLPYATSDLDWRDWSQYIEDYQSGNVGLWRIVCGAAYFIFHWLSNVGVGVGKPIRWIFDHLHFLWGGYPYPRRNGTIPDGESTPTVTLNLQPGELVRVKPHREILATLNTRSKNRGLFFDAEEVPYCGKTYRVLRRVDRIVNERTGYMQEMKTPCVILDSVICESRYSE